MNEMKDYEVTVKRTYKVQAESPARAVAIVLQREQGPDDFTLSEVTQVEEFWHRRESRVVAHREYVA